LIDIIVGITISVPTLHFVCFGIIKILEKGMSYYKKSSIVAIFAAIPGYIS
jgi:hypothetical protein